MSLVAPLFNVSSAGLLLLATVASLVLLAAARFKPNLSQASAGTRSRTATPRRKLVLNVLAIALLTPLLAAACSSSDTTAADKTPVNVPLAEDQPVLNTPPTPTASVPTPVPPAPGTAAAGECGPKDSAIAAIPRDMVRQFPAAPQMMINPAKQYTAMIQTSKGLITVDLDAADAPITTNNFVFLACHGFYDGLTFHRVVKTPQPFVIQGGDPKGDGTGGPGYAFNNEISPKLKHVLGAIAMANSGPNTNGSQFYITLSAQPGLDGTYNVFGKVSSGMDVANNIAMGDKIVSVSIQEK